MRLSKLAAAAFLGVAALGLSACANTLSTEVSRYQAMPAPQGQTFVVVPGEGMAANGGLEFQRYAAIVAQQLAARGYTPALDPQKREHGRPARLRRRPRPDALCVRSVPELRFGYGRYGGGFFYPRYGFRSPFYYGWDDPFWYGGGYGRGINSYIEYHGQIDLHIRAAGTNAPLFDGRAQARSQTNRLDVLVPSLVEALFTGFPAKAVRS